MLLGRREDVLGAARCLLDVGRVCRRRHPNPTYEEVCTGRTGHAEVVRVVFDPSKISYDDLLKVFWEAHNPTQGMRQGNDIGSQYRSILLTISPEQQKAAERSRDVYQQAMTAKGYGEITTSIVPLDEYYFAEEYHQQYLHKVPNGYCPIHATGVRYRTAEPAGGTRH